jgi:hypothetical protein
MPRKRPKTADDMPTYRKPILPSLPLADRLEGFVEGIQLRRIVEKYGAQGVELVLDLIAEQTRRELIDKRRRESQDAWKANVRPLGAAAPRLPSLQTVEQRRSTRRYRRHREESIDYTIREQARVRQLEAGLAIILEDDPDGWHRRELVDIVNGVRAGMTVAQIALDLGCSVSTVELRLTKLRNAAVTGEIEQLAGNESGK